MIPELGLFVVVTNYGFTESYKNSTERSYVPFPSFSQWKHVTLVQHHSEVTDIGTVHA